jgi:excisionase family DNA binding protein
VRTQLQPALDLARTLPLEELPLFLGELEQIRVTALARITAPAVESKPDELLNVEQTAARLNCSQNYLYRHSRRLPFTRRVGRKLLFSSSGLDLYLKKSK